MPEAQGTETYCEFSRLTRSYALTHSRENRHSHDALMHWLRGADFCRVTLNRYHIPYPHNTLTRSKPQIQCTMGNKTIYQSQTKRSLYNSISGATDYCALSLHITCIHRRSVGGGTCLPPQFLLASLGGHMPPKSFTWYIRIWKVYLKRISNFFKICLKFSKFSNILYKFCKVFLIFPTNHP